MQEVIQERLSQAFAVLNTPARIAILDAVLHDSYVQRGPVNPTEVAERLNLPVAKVSSAMKRMSEFGILRRRESGKYTFYEPDPDFTHTLKVLFNI